MPPALSYSFIGTFVACAGLGYTLASQLDEAHIEESIEELGRALTELHMAWP